MSKPTIYISQIDKEIAEIRKEMDVLEHCFIDRTFKIPSEQHLYYACLSVKQYRLKLKKEIDARNVKAPVDYNYGQNEIRINN